MGDVRPQKWIRQAMAEQEEHIKRVSSCRGEDGRSHAFRRFGDPQDASVVFSACVVCDVTESLEDYRRRTALEGEDG